MTAKGLRLDGLISQSLKVIKAFYVFLQFCVAIDFDIIRIAIHLPIEKISGN
jgi:hypothetical protein